MKAILLAIAVASSVLIATSLFYTSTAKNTAPLSNDPALKEFNNWMMVNGKSYGTNSEKDYRYGIFLNNKNLVEANKLHLNLTYNLLELKTCEANLKFNLWKLSHTS